MFTVASEPLELRGVATSKSKKGNTYYTINCETEDGTPHSFYCPEYEALPQGLKKGARVRLYFNVRYFKGQEKLEVYKVEEVAA